METKMYEKSKNSSFNSYVVFFNYDTMPTDI